jgi:PKD repeat protein
MRVDASCSADPDGSIASYSWNWGDGSALGTGKVVDHDYASNGTRAVTLFVTDGSGASGARSQVVTVIANLVPTACFTHAETGLGTAVNGACSSDADGAVASYRWDWGDGSARTMGAAATHAYAVAGTYDVALLVTDDSGVTAARTQFVTVVMVATAPPTACFTHAETYLAVLVDASCSTGPGSAIVSSSWDWGDGSAPGTGVATMHTFSGSGTFNVGLSVVDGSGTSGTASQFVTVTANQPPTACFTHSEDQLTTTVLATCSTDPDGLVTTYSWDWGDGSPPGAGSAATHTFSSGGTRAVTLLVGDDGASSAAASQFVTVVANQVPTACFTHRETALATRVDAGCSTDPDGAVASYAWTWGDGPTVAGGRSQNHTFVAPGTYTVTLFVTDNQGTTATVAQSMTVVARAANFQDPIALRSAASFAVLAAASVTNTGATAVTGDLGVSPGTAVTGFGPGTLTGTIHAGDGAAAQAAADLGLAYQEAVARANAPVAVTGDLGGRTLGPGLYRSTATLAVTSGDLILDALGDPDAVFVFQMQTTFSVLTGRQVLLAGGADADNIYWQVGTSATLGTNSLTKGNLMADQSITMNTGAALDGRALARVASITLDTNRVTVPT